MTGRIAAWGTAAPGTSSGRKPRLAHQRADDVAVIDVGLPLTLHPFHAFHQVDPEVDFHSVGVHPDLHLLADETGGHRVSPAGYLNGAPLAQPRPVVDVFPAWEIGAGIVAGR